MLFGACAWVVCWGGTAICDINPKITANYCLSYKNHHKTHHAGCRAEFHGDSALCSLIQERAGDKPTDPVRVARCQVGSHCGVACGWKWKLKKWLKAVDRGDSLCRAVCANDVLDLVVVRIQKRIGLGPKPDPLAVLGAEAVHDREHLSFLLENCKDNKFKANADKPSSTTYLGQSSLSCGSDLRDGRSRSSSCPADQLERSRAHSSHADPRTRTFRPSSAAR